MLRPVLVDSRKPGTSALSFVSRANKVVIKGMKGEDRLTLIYHTAAGKDEFEVSADCEVPIAKEVVYVQARHESCSNRASVYVDLST